MPVRAALLLNIGQPFHGFRFAVRPGFFGLDHPEAFLALEQAIERAYTALALYQPSAWRPLAERRDPALVPRLGERTGVLDFTGDAWDDTPGDVVARACLPFPLWPLGGWVVYEGRHRGPDGTWTPFSPEELDQLW